LRSTLKVTNLVLTKMERIEEIKNICEWIETYAYDKQDSLLLLNAFRLQMMVNSLSERDLGADA